MTRLIDAEALKKVICDNYDCEIGLYCLIDLIDNAPTVELQSCVAKVTLSEEQLNEIVARVTEKSLSERILRDV